MKNAPLLIHYQKLLSVALLIIILPFVLLYWMAPFVADLTLGADYQLFSINEQQELRFAMEAGTFPLYIPGYKLGHSSSALTLGQMYHPISHIVSLLPGYWRGYALEWNTFFRLLSLGITQFVLFSFLRRLSVGMLFSFLFSLITVYNLRMLEAFRYGASLEAFTGYLLLNALIGWYFMSPSRWLGPLCIMGGTYLLVCSGHPPMMLYGLVGALLFTFVAPFFLSEILSDRRVDLIYAIRFWMRTGFFIVLGILLSSAYLVPFYIEVVRTNIEYTRYPLVLTGSHETILGAFNNFFMPFISDILSSFGGSSLFILPLLIPLLKVAKVRIVPSVWAIWGILLFAFVYMLGPRTPLFGWAWEFIPGVSSTGGAGRISLIIPFFMMLLLVWISRESLLSFRLKGRSASLAPYVFLGLIGIVLIPAYLTPVFIVKPKFGYFTPHLIRNIPFWVEFLSVVLGIASLAALAGYGLFTRWRRILGVCLCITVTLHIGILLKYGMFVERKVETPTLEQMKLQKEDGLYYGFYENPGLYHAVVLRHLEKTFMEPFLGKIYTRIIPVESQSHAYEEMRKSRLPQELYIEKYYPENAMLITEGAEDMKEGMVELMHSSYNFLQFRVYAEKRAFFGLAYPYTGHWQAWINGKKTETYRANGINHALEIPSGESIVKFRYWSSAFFWGMMISCATLAAIAVFVFMRGFRGALRWMSMVMAVIMSIGIFALWYEGLYGGEDLKTKYRWTYEHPPQLPNIAYGKKSTIYEDGRPVLRVESGRAVDGNRVPGSGITITSPDAALVVDLGKATDISKIMLYGDRDTRPRIFLSLNGSDWMETLSPFRSVADTDSLHVIYEESANARYIKFFAPEGKFIIDELEVYARD